MLNCFQHGSLALALAKPKSGGKNSIKFYAMLLINANSSLSLYYFSILPFLLTKINIPWSLPLSIFLQQMIYSMIPIHLFSPEILATSIFKVHSQYLNVQHAWTKNVSNINFIFQTSACHEIHRKKGRKENKEGGNKVRKEGNSRQTSRKSFKAIHLKIKSLPFSFLKICGLWSGEGNKFKKFQFNWVCFSYFDNSVPLMLTISVSH